MSTRPAIASYTESKLSPDSYRLSRLSNFMPDADKSLTAGWRAVRTNRRVAARSASRAATESPPASAGPSPISVIISPCLLATGRWHCGRRRCCSALNLLHQLLVLFQIHLDVGRLTLVRNIALD